MRRIFIWILLFLLLINFVSALQTKLDFSQALSQNLLEDKGNNVYMTKGMRITTFNSNDLLKLFDKIMVLGSGEIELYVKEKPVALVYGKIQLLNNKLLIKDGNLRKSLYSHELKKRYEIILLKDNSFKLINFYLEKSKEGLVLNIPKGIDILTLTRSNKGEDIFINGINDLPLKIGETNLFFLKFAGEATSSLVWNSLPLEDSFSFKGKFKLTSETAQTLKSKNLDKDKAQVEFFSEEISTLFFIPWEPSKEIFARLFLHTPNGEIKVNKHKISSLSEDNKFQILLTANFENYYIFGKKIIAAIDKDISNNLVFMTDFKYLELSAGRYYIKHPDMLISSLKGNLQISADPKSFSNCLRHQNRICYFSSPSKFYENTIWVPKELKDTNDNYKLSISFNSDYKFKLVDNLLFSTTNVYLNGIKGKTRNVIFCDKNGNCMYFYNGHNLKLMPQGTSWQNFDFGFYTKIYDSDQNIIRNLECKARSYCSIDGSKMYSPKSVLKCRSNNDCLVGTCILEKGVCSKPSDTCKKLGGYNGKLDLLFVGVGYDTESELKKDVNYLVNNLFLTDPFDQFKQKFSFHYKSIPSSSLDLGFTLGLSASYYNLMLVNKFIAENAKCTGVAPDYPIFVFKDKIFRPVAFRNNVLLPMKVVKSLRKYTLNHELGHSIGGLVDEYYHFGLGRPGHQGPNCINQNNAASFWGKYLDPISTAALVNNAKSNWLGCGGVCDKRCSLYLRPSETSLMKDTRIKDFNEISRLVMKAQLSKY
ncbi:MAG: hypothetical protein U9Q69_03135 [Nanoarchaeota archaeon]|nr:hypothetical protein [Nanoarchaeota archaeon]